MLVTQKMSMPPPANEQAAMQQKMMKYMMIFFGLMFYKVAGGLCLYLIVSSLWGIAERKLLPKAQIGGCGGHRRWRRLGVQHGRQTATGRWLEWEFGLETAAQGETEEVDAACSVEYMADPSWVGFLPPANACCVCFGRRSF